MMEPSMLGDVHRTSFENMECSVARCLEVVGEWWSLLIVRDAMLGVTRFDDFQARLGISRNILTRRLSRLVDNGILKRVPYSDHPPRWEYRLTAQGRDLWLVVTAMRQWGDRWASPAGSPVLIRHSTGQHSAGPGQHEGCEQIVSVLPACSGCGEILDPRSVTSVPGPGASAETFARTAV